jgi:transposase
LLHALLGATILERAMAKTKTKSATRSKIRTTVAAEVRYRRRSDAVAAVGRGEKVADVARVHGVDIGTVFRWLARYRSQGKSALRDEPRSGRPRKISEKVERWLRRALTRDTPGQHKLDSHSWTLEVIRRLLKREQGIDLSKSSVSRLIARLGVSM